MLFLAAILASFATLYYAQSARSYAPPLPAAEAFCSATHATPKREKFGAHGLGRCALNPDACINDRTSESEGEGGEIYTAAVLKVAYDGTYFRGSAANSATNNISNADGGNVKDNKSRHQRHDSTQKRQSRRSRTLQRKGGAHGKNGEVRTIEGTLTSALAKLYGDVDRRHIKMESCSRTDAGVHAASWIAQFYCAPNAEDGAGSGAKSAARRPDSGGDDLFLPLPFDSDLSKLVFVLNRMLPPDVRVLAASPLPTVPSSLSTNAGFAETANGGRVPFHPSLHTLSKTYVYRFAIGFVHDPLETKYVWHLDGSSARAVGMSSKRFCFERAMLAADLFVDPEPRDFGAFRSAFRGSDRGRVQSTMCRLWQCDILREKKELLPSWEADGSNSGRMGKASLLDSGAKVRGLNKGPQTFSIVITGDRFLYKMVRNIVGTVVAVGCGHIELEKVSIALASGTWHEGIGLGEVLDKTDTAPSKIQMNTGTTRRICAPARGLTLVKVQYPDSVKLDWQAG
ncbi:hypothetical protein ACHAWF_016452 [Thalassiosira exigua]